MRNERIDNERTESIRTEFMRSESMREDERMNLKMMRMIERLSLAMLAMIAYGLMTQIAADDVIGMILIRVIAFLLGAAFVALTVMDVFAFAENYFGDEDDWQDEDLEYEENDEPDWLDSVEIVDFMNYDLSNRNAKCKAV